MITLEDLKENTAFEEIDNVISLYGNCSATETRLANLKRKKERELAYLEREHLIEDVSQYLNPGQIKCFEEKAPFYLFKDRTRLREFCNSIEVSDSAFEGIVTALNLVPENESPQLSKEVKTTELMSFIQMIADFDAINFFSKIPDVNGHFVKKHLYVRDCYSPLRELILKEGENYNVCITGDPGIGKSYFSLYMFFWFVKSGKPVVRIGNGGSSLTFDGAKITFNPNGIDDYWRLNDVWLLLDGCAEKKYWEKSARGVVFASPKGSNFHEFIKVQLISKSLLYSFRIQD